MAQLTYRDIEHAAKRISGHVRPVAVTPAQPTTTADGASYELFFALEFMQHTGSFKARGAQNFLQAHLEAGSLLDAGVTIASGGNAGLACAWAAGEQKVPATVFLPETAPAVKVDRLRGYGARVELVGQEYAEAAAACERFAADSGALVSHAYDHPLIAAGAGTVLPEILTQVPDLDTVVVAVGGGGLFSGVAAAAAQHGVRVVAVEPEHCRALHAGLAAGAPVDVPVDSVAADSLGARRASAMAVAAARSEHVDAVLVADADIIRARRELWENHRMAVEYAAGAALAGVRAASAYVPSPGEKVAVILCGANTDVADLSAGRP